MTILSGRWDIDYVAKRVFRLVAVTPTVTDTSLALYSALQDEFDEPAQMDDEVPQSAQTPTAFTMINQWFMDNLSTQFLTGGALTTLGWASGEVVSISYDASAGVALVAADVGRTITGTTTTDSGTILSFDERYGTDLGVMYIRPDDPATDLFDNTTEAWTIGGSSGAGIFSVTYEASAARTGESLWPNIFALGTLESFTQLYVIQNQLKIVDTEIDAAAAPWWPEGFFDILVRTTEQGTAIDDSELMVGARQFGSLFDHFVIDVSAGGRNPVPLSTGPDDLNNPDGTFNQVFTDSADGTGPFQVGELVTSASNGKRGIVTAVSGTNPTITIEYVDIGTAATREFEVGDGTITGAIDGANGTAVASVAVNQNNLGTPPTLVVANTDASLGAGEPLAPYSLQWDTNQNNFLDVYGYWKLVVRRGEGTGDVIDTAFTAQAGAETITGEQYIGNVLQGEYGTQTGAFVEGEIVWDQTTGAFGTVVADHDDGATGDLILRNVRGTFGNNVVGDAPSAPTDFATFTSTRTIAPVKVAPFGTLAGGVIFGAPGVLITDILAAESQNFQLIDDDGTVRTPPITVQVTVDGLHASANDRAAVFVLDLPLSSDGVIVRNTYTMTAAAATENGVGDSNVEADAAIANDTPDAGWVSVVDDSLAATTGQEYNFEYDSFSGQIWTLTPITLTGAQLYDGAGDATGTILDDADASFISNGVKVGHIVRNVTDTNSWGIVRTVAAAQVTHTPLQGGATDEWDPSDAYEINTIPVDFTTSDTAYVPIILEEGLTSITSGTMTHIGDRDIMIRVRNGGSVSPIIPFETGTTLTSANLTITAIRNLDTIAT